jgi:hypothetical protein
MLHFILGCLNLFCAGMNLDGAILGYSGAWYKLLLMVFNIFAALYCFLQNF